MKNYLFLLSVFSVSVFNVNAESVKETEALEGRIEKLENLVHSDPFIYDLKLRQRIDGSISKQEGLDDMLDRLRAELEKTNDSIDGIDRHKAVEIEKKLSDVKKELLSIFEIAKSLHQENMQSMSLTNKSAMEAASKSAEDANQRFKNFTESLIVIAALLTLLSGVFSYLFVRASGRVKKSNELHTIMEKSLVEEMASLVVIKRELLTLHKMLDLRENFRSYKAKGYKAEYLQEVVYNEAKELLIELEDIGCEHKNGYEKEIEANISYCAALLGLVSYYKQKYSDAYQYFIRAEQTNTHNHSDRIFNLGCLAAKLYKETADDGYLKIVVDNYIKLFRYKGEAIEFRSDKDIKPIIKELDSQLEKKGLDNLILPSV